MPFSVRWAYLPVNVLSVGKPAGGDGPARTYASGGGVGRSPTCPVRTQIGGVAADLHGARRHGHRPRVQRTEGPHGPGQGADHTVVSIGGAFVEPVRALTGGEGADVVFDGGGETTFRASLNVLRRHGLLLCYGAVIGAVPVINMRELPNSVKVSYPVFRDHIPTREALLRHSDTLFDLVRRNVLNPGIGGRYPLADAARAHRDIVSRATSGKLLLLPQPRVTP
ncbi:zinc-binding dehydrogenase [Streptomyces sp. NPDC052023]|uniref:zinc-binding dehydrogenase n=1 Tax=Streptomyces sp. NPDC052023 TaxID=3365681 RepID=UPI0037D20DE3